MNDGKRGIQSVEAGFGLLDCLARAAGPLALKEIADRCGMSPSRAHSYLVSLVRSGLVEQVGPLGRYDLGVAALRLGLAAMQRSDVIEQGRSALHALREETGATAFLALWGNKGPTIVNWVEGRDPVTVFLRAGSVLPLLGSATGQLFLAWLPSEQTAALLAEEHATTAEVQRVQEAVLAEGLAVIDGTLIPGVAAVAAPVCDHERRLRAVLTLMGRSGSFDPSAGGISAAALRKATVALSRRLGCPG